MQKWASQMVANRRIKGNVQAIAQISLEVA